jgi:hypothetical protein
MFPRVTILTLTLGMAEKFHKRLKIEPTSSSAIFARNLNIHLWLINWKAVYVTYSSDDIRHFHPTKWEVVG